jgi:tetratricopeptide (TPR) repeat protein
MQMLAGIYITTEQFGKAKEWYLKACTNDTSVFVLKQIGWCCDKLLQDQEAEYYYIKAINLDPDDYQPVFRLGNLYKDQRDYEQAIAVTDSFLTRHPDNREVTRLSGYAHYLNQTFRKSIARYQCSLELSDSSAFVLKYLGYSYFKLAEYPNAIKYMEKVYTVDSSDADLCWALGLAHDVPQNIRYFERAITLGLPVLTAMAKVYLDLSLAYTKAWRYNEALDALNNALSLRPGDAGVIYKLAVHYDNWMDDKLSALKYYKEFMATHPDDSSDYFMTGISVVNRSDYDQAERRIKDIEQTAASVVEADTLTGPEELKLTE